MEPGRIATEAELVNQAISEGIIETYKAPNPKEELFPTTACRLNRQHDLVKRVLGPGSPKKHQSIVSAWRVGNGSD